MNSLAEERRQAALDELGLDSFERTAFNDLVKLAPDNVQVLTYAHAVRSAFEHKQRERLDWLRLRLTTGLEVHQA